MTMDNLPRRKKTRLEDFNYSTPGAYFITICTENRRNLLGKIVGGGAFDAPKMRLSADGKIVEKYIRSGDRVENVKVDKFIIMPNHIHMILFVEDGPSRAPAPTDKTRTNETIPHFVSTLKRFVNRDADRNLFQRSYHDHVIRGEADYLQIWQYIDSNPAKWQEDCFYNEAEENL